jgi:hypothetical protein
MIKTFAMYMREYWHDIRHSQLFFMLALQPGFVLINVLFSLRDGFKVGFYIGLLIILLATVIISFAILMTTREERKERVRLRVWREQHG